MSNLAVTKRLRFCCAHRLDKDMGMCHNIHGHNYLVELTVEPTTLCAGPSGSVIDFKMLKDKCQKHLDDTYDHRLLLKEGDTLIATLKGSGIEVVEVADYPTAEWMAKRFIREFESLLTDLVRVVSVTVWETENSYATAWR